MFSKTEFTVFRKFLVVNTVSLNILQNRMSAEMKVLFALRNQAAAMRRARQPAEGIAAGKWELFFDAQIEELKRRESCEQPQSDPEQAVAS
jgi:hypothetical protein